MTDTVDFANLVLPASQWGEKEGVMTSSDRTITYNRPFREPPPQCKHDWQIFCDVAKKLGWEEAFSYKTARDIFNEYKKTTEGRLCDISDWDYEDLPKQWGGKWLYRDKKFPTPTGKAKFNPAVFEPPADKVEYPFSFILTTGRTKKQWHTMTRTGKAYELLRNEEEPFIMLNEEDAYELGIIDGDYITIQSERGKIYLKAKIGEIKEGVAFAPFGYGRVFHFPTNTVVSDAIDPISKEPDLKFSSIFIKAKSRKVYKLSEESINVVQQSYPKIKGSLNQIMEKLYTYLFKKYPEMKDMFEQDINELAKQQAELFGAFVENIENLEKIEDLLDRVVKKHVEKKVQPNHYKAFGEAFIKALTNTCKLTYAEREAWKDIYEYLSNILSSKEKKLYEEKLKKVTKL